MGSLLKDIEILNQFLNPKRLSHTCTSIMYVNYKLNI